MDHTLAYIIHPMLVQLKKTQHGAPNTSDEDVPEALRSTSAPPKKNDWDVDKYHFKRWDWILSEMIWTFGEIKRDKEPNFWIKKPKYGWKDVPETKNGKQLVILRKGERNEEKEKAYHDRMRNGLRLFGKYYQNLWD